jgi:hypothetical protein
MILNIFLHKNAIVILISFLVMVLALLNSSMIAILNSSLIVFASIIYFISTYFFIEKNKDFTDLTWAVSFPLVLYGAVFSVENLKITEAEKFSNSVFYLGLYFFSISLLYRGAILFKCIILNKVL